MDILCQDSHQEVPQAIYDDQADVGIKLYQLTRYVTKRFPNHFEIDPLGGTVDEDPKSFGENKVAVLYAVKIRKSNARKNNVLIRDDSLVHLKSQEFEENLPF